MWQAGPLDVIVNIAMFIATRVSWSSLKELVMFLFVQSCNSTSIFSSHRKPVWPRIGARGTDPVLLATSRVQLPRAAGKELLVLAVLELAVLQMENDGKVVNDWLG